MSKFVKHFKQTIKEATAIPQQPQDDVAAFNQSFSDPQNAEAISSEMSNIGLDPQHTDKLIKQANMYAIQIEKMLSILNDVHRDIVQGKFKPIAPDIKGISGITENLAKLAQSLRSRVLDGVQKANDTEKKAQ